ncbi:MAG TPA: hypothetical protein VIJ64_02585, partial [Candidatus Lustribacter sp.]
MFVGLVLSAAMLAAAPATLTLHPSARTSVSIGGAQGALTAIAENDLVTVTPDAQPGVLDILSSARTGTDSLHVTDAAGDSVDIPVRVADDAGTFPSQVQMTVTGSPLQWSWLWQQILAAVARTSTVAPGATLTAASPAPQLPPAPGAQL